MEAGTQLEPVRVPRRHPEAYYNISAAERKVSLAVGAASLAYGLRHGGAVGWTAGVTGGFLTQRGLTGHCYANQLLGRNSARAGDRGRSRQGPQRFTTQLTIARRPDELYRFWRDFTRLPTFMRFITEVRPAGGNRTHWVAEGPWAERTGRLEWDAEVTEDVPDERIAWRSVEGSDVEQRGEIRFRATARGTEVQLDLTYAPPAGRLSAVLGRFMNTLSKEAARADLRRFKQLMETGEIATNATTRAMAQGGA
ncbi:MAG: SRPBCC family protein [Halofilum sp. (in: g-proteobacteria)]